ncbi:MAG: 1-acyl-sn-glycerol-3-phosphate acyltransferase [Deltaproteobacteria bacterium]|nr:1-acyl-sn-glycerol-3-phosphate acyltransferase [Deltaproteobacteria bacterium]
MTIKSGWKSFGRQIGEYYSGFLYEEKKSPLFRLLNTALSKVKADEEGLEDLKALSKEGVVVYALKNKSQLNCLILRNILARGGVERPVYCHGINMILWQPFRYALKSIISRFFHNPFRNEYLKRVTKNKKSAIVYLRGSESIGGRDAGDPLGQLIDAQRDMDVPIFLVPQLVAYGRRREKKDKSLTGLLFGETENPGMLRRLITFFRYYSKAFVLSSKPVNLSEFLKNNSGKSRETISYLLRRELIDRVDEEKRAIVGPVLKSREEIVGMVLRDPELVKFMEDMASTGREGHGAIVGKARKYLFEIAAGYNDTYVGFMDRILTWLWNDIYDGVVIDKEGLSKMRDISKKMPFVVIPCHRSHIDYLLISYVFYYNNIQLPFIAAGTNLLFWPLGYFFRNLGAFFIRRTIGGKALYGEVLAKYVKTLLEEGLPIEFFIEGGRSRTGKMVMPKYGLLSMIMQAYREGSFNDLALVPIFIGYDKVIEEKSYLRELGGASKEKEKIRDLIKSRKVLRKRYGRVYMNVGKPMLLKSYLASHEVPIEDMTTLERRALYRRMGYEIVNEINKVSVVSPSALVAAGLLCHYRRGISHDDLMDILSEFHDYLASRGAKFSSTFANREKALNDALGMFESAGLISRMGPEEEDEEDEFEETIYSVDEDKRLNLEYYKNNILHSFVSLSFMSISILSCDGNRTSLSEVMEDYRFFKELFMDEFIYDNKVDDHEEVQRVVSYARDKGMIVIHERAEGSASIEVTGKGRVPLQSFAGLIQNYLESYWVVSRGCAYLKNRVRQEKDLIKKVQKLGTKMYKKGEISKAEALSQSTYKNALKYLIDSGAISVSGSKGDKGAKFLSLEDRNLLESLRRRLFKFMM